MSEKNVMPFEFDEELITQARIKVVGVGGAGGNAINRMIDAGLSGVEFIAVNTDAQVLEQNRAATKIQIGKHLTKGLGAGANPDIGRQAMEEDGGEVAVALAGADMVFVTAGMGGGTGTGAAPMVAKMAKLNGALTVAIVTKPFEFEGKKRMTRADEGLSELRRHVDTQITIPNQKLLAIADRNTLLTDAFTIADNVLYQATKGISDLITIAGLINCDFADIRTVMLEMGHALMGTGEATGPDKASAAAQMAVSSPLLENVAIAGAKGVLINVTGGPDMTLFDVNDATSRISDAAGTDANIIVGAVIDPNLTDTIRVTVIATGFGPAMPLLPFPEEEKVRTAVPVDLFASMPKPAPVSNRIAAETSSRVERTTREVVYAEADSPDEPLAPPEGDNGHNKRSCSYRHTVLADAATAPMLSLTTSSTQDDDDGDGNGNGDNDHNGGNGHDGDNGHQTQELVFAELSDFDLPTIVPLGGCGGGGRMPRHVVVADPKNLEVPTFIRRQMEEL